MPDSQVPKFVLLTDPPPLREGGYGCHVLAWNWLHAVMPDVRLVVTRRFNRALELETLAAGLPAPICFYPDLSRARGLGRLPALKSLLEVLLLVIWLPRIVRAVRSSGADRIFAFFGGNAWFLLVSWCVAAATRLPLDVYLVEDLEESNRIHRQRLSVWLARWCEPRLLRRAARVFAISRGFAEFLADKHGINAEWLPPAIASEPIQHRTFVPEVPDARVVTFIGAVNPPNEGALKDFLNVVEQWNRSAPPFKLRLLVMTYSEPAYLQAVLGSSPNLDVLHRPPREEMLRRMRASWAIFIPYSFSPEMRVMVTTAFPTKLTDSLPIGRPLLIYGPDYASVPRYFAENVLPLSVTRREDLIGALQQVEGLDTVSLMRKYEATIARVHSHEAIRARLALPVCSEGARG